MAQGIKKIRVLFTIPNFDTAGSGKALLKVAKGLDKKKFEAHICCMHSKGVYFKEVEKSGLPVHILNYTTKMKPYYKGLWNCIKISRIFRKINPDIIHSFHYAADYSEALAAKFAGIKWIYTKKNMNWGGSSKNGWKLRTLLANAVAAQNTDMMLLFFKNKNNVFLIPRGVDTSEFQSRPPLSSLRERWGLLESARVLICVANLVPVKGVEVLIQAFSNVCKTDTEWTLMIVGDNNNEYGKSLQCLVKDLELTDHIIFTGKQQNICDYLNIGEVFVLPTLNEGRKEGSPVSLLEAMACEKNVLGSKIPGIKDQLHDFKNNLVEAGNVAAWKKELTLVCNNSVNENKQQGKVLRTHVLSHYKIELEVNKCEKMYLETYGKNS